MTAKEKNLQSQLGKSLVSLHGPTLQLLMDLLVAIRAYENSRGKNLMRVITGTRKEKKAGYARK